MYKFTLVLWLCLFLVACQGNSAEKPTQTFTAYDLQFKLPEGWAMDRGQLQTFVSGGFGFASPDYKGLTYLRLHQGAVFAVLGDWEMSENAATILASAFADDISETRPIQVLGYEGTLAHGKLEQGQGIGAIHVKFEQDGVTRQFAFLCTVANTWSAYEEQCLAIINTVEFIQNAP